MDNFEDYRLIFKETADLALGNGIKSIKNEYPIVSISSLDNLTEELKKKFLIGCHDGFKKAQKNIINEIIKYQKLFKDLDCELKEYRRIRNKQKEQEIHFKILIVKQRIHNFSHIADGIAWQLFGGQIHIARRFYIEEKSSKFLESSNIQHAIKVSEEINKDPQNFALISDLTNYIQIGDLLVRFENSLGIMELKEGEINEQIKDFFAKNKIVSEEILRENFNENTVKQVMRMQRQEERSLRAIEVINEGVGLDPVSQQNLILSTPQIITENYYDELHELYKDLENNSCSYCLIENCLHIGMYRDEAIVVSEFLIENLLGQETENYILFDWLSITENISEPLFIKPFPSDFIIDILTGKVKVIIGLNLDLLIETFNKNGLTTRWMSTKETAKAKQSFKRKGIVEIKNKGIVSNLANGTEIFMGGGIISKIIFDSIKPSNIAKTIVSSLGKST